MAVSYKVDLAELARVLDRLDSWQQTLQARVAELEAANDDLHLTWEGEAAAAQTVAHRKLTQGAAEVRAGLRTMHEAGRRAHDSYQAAAEANVRTWSQLR